MRYYSTQRPVGPGTFPKLPENKVLEVHNFDAKTFCEEIGREAWGYIDFESPLTQEQADNYELIAPGVGCTGCVNETASRDRTAAGTAAGTGVPRKTCIGAGQQGDAVVIDYAKILTELEEERAACQYVYGGMIPAFYTQALHRAIEAVKECQDCAAEAGRMAKEVSRHDMA